MLITFNARLTKRQGGDPVWNLSTSLIIYTHITDETVTVKEAIQRLQAFITDTTFTPTVARQVALINIDEQEGLAFLSEAMSGCVVDENCLSDDPDGEGESDVLDIRLEAQQVLAIVRARKL